MPKLHLIYVPGLGDKRVGGQAKVVSTWRFWGVKSELFQMNWADGEPWDPKFGRLLARIDELQKDGKSVGLVGASAGAGAVINAYAARKDKVAGAVLIAGKVNRPGTIGNGYRHKNPAFVESANQAPKSLKALNASDRKRILSLYAIADETVYKPDSHIRGAHNSIVPTIGHFFTIAILLSLGAPYYISFLKRHARKSR